MITFVGDVRKKPLYTRWYKRTPEQVRSVPVSLQELGHAPIPNHWSDYNPDTHLIRVYRGHGDIPDNVLHELGHHLYYAAFTEPQRVAWHTFYPPNSHLLDRRMYGWNDELECFPECCAYLWRRAHLPPVFVAWFNQQRLLPV